MKAVTLCSVLASIAFGQLSQVNVSSLLVPSAAGLCYQCLYQNSTAIYLTGMPSCTVSGVALLGFKAGQCYNAGTYLSYVNSFCQSGYVENYMQCPNQCTAGITFLQPGNTYTAAANSLCQYQVFVSKSVASQLAMNLNPTYSPSLSFYVKSIPFANTAQNYQLGEYNARTTPFMNGTYVLVVNRGSTDTTFITFPVSGAVPAPPMPTPPSPTSS